MYEQILGVRWSEVRTEKYFGYVAIDPVKRIITIRNNCTVDSFSDSSDIVVYYNMLEDSYPILVVERVAKKSCSKRKFKAAMKKLRQEMSEYRLLQSEYDEYYDIVLIKDSLFISLT